MEQSPVEIIQAILADPTNPEVVEHFVAADATYVSLNYDNPELNRTRASNATGRTRIS